MQKFLLHSLYFVLPVLLLTYPLDILISKNLKKSNGFAESEYSTWNDIMEGRVNSNIVIYGSSRAWVHIDPIMIGTSFNTSAYNLGIDGQNFGLQYLRHSLLLKHNQRPHTIIHSLDLFTLQEKKDLFNADQFLPYMLWNNEIDSIVLSYNSFNFFDFNIPLVRYYGKAKAMDMAFKILMGMEPNRPQRNKGYQAQNRKWNSDLEKAKRKAKKFKITIDSSLTTAFEKYLIECKKKNIKLIFVYTPEYIEGQHFVENREQVIRIYSDFARKYSIPFYDFSNDKLSFEKKYFYNSSHLNKTGSVLFTKKLANILKQDTSKQRTAEY